MNIFAYGSLMVPSIFESVTGGKFLSQNAQLAGFKRLCLKKDTYPGIAEDDKSITDGIIYFNVDETALKKLDVFEGEYYRRTPVSVIVSDDTGKAGDIAAQTYVIRHQYRHILSDRPWDFEEFKNRFQAQFKRKYFGFSAITGS